MAWTVGPLLTIVLTVVNSGREFHLPYLKVSLMILAVLFERKVSKRFKARRPVSFFLWLKVKWYAWGSGYSVTYRLNVYRGSPRYRRHFHSQSDPINKIMTTESKRTNNKNFMPWLWSQVKRAVLNFSTKSCFKIFLLVSVRGRNNFLFTMQSIEMIEYARITALSLVMSRDAARPLFFCNLTTFLSRFN